MKPTVWALFAWLLMPAAQADKSVSMPAYLAERQPQLAQALQHNRCDDARRYTERDLYANQHIDWLMAAYYTGVCYEDQGDGRRALSLYQQTITNAAQDPKLRAASREYVDNGLNNLYLRMAQLYQGQKGVAADADKARAACLHVIDTPSGKNNDLAHLLLAQWSMRGGRPAGPFTLQTLGEGGLQSSLLLIKLAEQQGDNQLRHQALERAWGWASDDPALQQSLAAQIGQDYQDGKAVTANQTQALYWYLQSGEQSAAKIRELAPQLPYRLILENGREWGMP